MLLNAVRSVSAQPKPSPSATNNHYYPGNWHRGDAEPVPRWGIKPNDQEAHEADQVPQIHAPPMERIGDEADTSRITTQDKDQLTVEVTGDVSVKRDFFDKLSLCLNFVLLLFIAWQLWVLGQTYIADDRPRLTIRHIAFTTNQDDLFIVDDSGNIKFARADFTFVISNRGATKSRVTERNLTLRQVGRTDNIEDVLRSFRQKEMPLPEMNKETGLPIYDAMGTVSQHFKLRPDEERSLTMSRISQSINEAVDMHLSLSGPRGAKHLRFFAMGYFKYRDRTGRK